VIRCNGLFRHGFLLAPVITQGVADMIADKDNEFLCLFTGEDNADRDRQRPEKNLHRAA
jgi:glycine/D-amino acid oxidase-like deaminating enzyme